MFGIEIDESAICFFDGDSSKKEVLDALVDAMSVSGDAADVEAFRNAIHERESIMSTGIGSGVAIPHVRIDNVPKPAVGLGICKDGLNFETFDGQPVHVIVLFAMPSNSHREYLSILSRVMTKLRMPDFRAQFLGCDSPAEVAELLRGNEDD